MNGEVILAQISVTIRLMQKLNAIMEAKGIKLCGEINEIKKDKDQKVNKKQKMKVLMIAKKIRIMKFINYMNIL